MAASHHDATLIDDYSHTTCLDATVTRSSSADGWS